MGTDSASVQIRLEDYWQRERVERLQLRRKMYSDSEGVAELFDLHSAVARLINQCARFTDKVRAEFKKIELDTAKIEDAAYALARRVSADPQLIPKKRPSSFVVTLDELKAAFPPKGEWVRETHSEAINALSSYAESRDAAVRAILAGKYPPNSVPCRSLSSEDRPDGSISFTPWYGENHPSDPGTSPNAIRDLAEFIAEFHNGLARIDEINRNYSRWDVFAAVSPKPRKVLHETNASYHAAWVDVLRRTFYFSFWTTLCDVNDSYCESDPDPTVIRAPIDTHFAAEMLKGKAVQFNVTNDDTGETSSGEGYRYVLHDLYEGWGFWLSRRRHESRINKFIAALWHEFLQAVDRQRQRDSIVGRIQPALAAVKHVVTSQSKGKPSQKQYIYNLAMKQDRHGEYLTWQAIAVRANRKFKACLDKSGARAAANRYAEANDLPMPTRQAQNQR